MSAEQASTATDVPLWAEVERTWQAWRLRPSDRHRVVALEKAVDAFAEAGGIRASSVRSFLTERDRRRWQR